MKIQTYCLANNEEKIMPYFMRHYNQFSDVILLESNSTDRTIEIANSMGAEIWSYEREDEINDKWFTNIKNNCWKNSKADWVIVVDTDEFVYHPDIIRILNKSKATLIQPMFYNMLSENFPTIEGQIYEEVNMGMNNTVWGNKINIFRPSEIKEMDYETGCHAAHPHGNVIIDDKTDIKTLHMRFLSRQYVIDRTIRNTKRMSKLNISQGWGFPIWTIEQINKYFDDNLPMLKKII